MRLNTTIYWLIILLAFAIYPLFATKIFAAEPILETVEYMGPTKNGCNTLIHFYVRGDHSEIMKRRIEKNKKDELAKSDWDGECLNGVTTGAGKLTSYIFDGIPMFYEEGVHLNGSAVGLSKVYYNIKNAPEIVKYEWNGTQYYQRNLSLRPIAPRKFTEEPPMLMKTTPTQNIIFALLQDAGSGELGRCGKQAEVISCVQHTIKAIRPCANNILEKCKAFDVVEEKFYPCSNDCLQKWNQHSQPLLADYQAFVDQSRSEIDTAVNSAMAQVLAERAERIRQKEKLVQEAQRNAANAARVQQAINDANKLRRPVASPNLDALIKKIKGRKP